MWHPYEHKYHPSEDVSKEINGVGIQMYQLLIGISCWAFEVGRVDMFLEVSLLLSHIAFPRARDLQADYRWFGYLKQVPKRQLYVYPEHPDISEYRLHEFDWEEFYRDTSDAISLGTVLLNQMHLSSADDLFSVINFVDFDDTMEIVQLHIISFYF